jgi:hypothetical protein
MKCTIQEAKSPENNLVMQRHLEGFNSGVKGLMRRSQFCPSPRGISFLKLQRDIQEIWNIYRVFTKLYN